MTRASAMAIIAPPDLSAGALGPQYLTADVGAPLRLRRLVLSLAVRGAIVEQRPTEGTAHDLLRHLGKVGERPDVASQGLSAIELPASWCWATFTEAATIESNLVDPKKHLDLPHVAPDNIEKATGRLLEYRTIREDAVISSKHHFFPGQVLYSKIRPNLSKVVVVDFEGLCSADMYPLGSRIDARYLQVFLLSDVFLQQVVRDDNRIAMPKVNQQQLSATVVALPPLPEQKRIVAKVDQLMALCDELETKQTRKREVGDRLTRAALAALTSAETPEDIEVAWTRVSEDFASFSGSAERVPLLRRAIREMAIRGRLVPRTLGGAPDAGGYLALVAEERSALMAGRRVGARGHLSGEEREQEGPAFQIPANWHWCRLKDVAGHIVDGTHHTPRYVERGRDFISAKDIRRGRVEFDGCRQISNEEFDELTKRCRPKRGDVLVTKSGSIGEVAVVDSDRDFTLFESVALVPVVPSVNPDFIGVVVHLGATGAFGIDRRKGIGVPHLHLVDLREMPVPLPPREEQDRIVQRVSALLSICDDLEMRLRDRDGKAAQLAEALVGTTVNSPA